MIVPISIVIPVYKTEKNVEVWVQERETADEFKGLLEFPGGKIEKNENPRVAGAREVLEETGVNIPENELLKFKNYDFEAGAKTILLMVFLYFDKEEKFPKSGRYSLQELRLKEKEIPPKNSEILVDLLEYFR